MTVSLLAVRQQCSERRRAAVGKTDNTCMSPELINPSTALQYFAAKKQSEEGEVTSNI